MQTQMNVSRNNIIATYTQLVQTQMEVTLVLALMVITGMEKFVLVNAIYFVVKSLFSICIIKRLYGHLFIFHTDINECTNGQHTCNLQATCTNTDGSYTCTCIDGYTGDGDICFGKHIVVFKKLFSIFIH